MGEVIHAVYEVVLIPLLVLLLYRSGVELIYTVEIARLRPLVAISGFFERHVEPLFAFGAHSSG